MNDLRSRGTRITFVAVAMDEKESRTKSVAEVGLTCIVKDSEERRRDHPLVAGK